MSKTIVVVGAGAAGLMAAIHAAGPERRVLLLERTVDGGRKILISGGGRCNVLPSVLDEERYVTASSRPLMKKLLRAWSLTEQRTFFEEALHLPLVREEETGKLFPVADKARIVRDALVNEARRRSVEWHPHTQVMDLRQREKGWEVLRGEGAPLRVDAVILATGGLSVPQTGSDGFAFDFLKRLGHELHPTYPALTPLTLTPPLFGDLAGLSLHARLESGVGSARRASAGGFLFTHRGYSGPSVLDISDVAVRSRLSSGPPAELRVAWGRLERSAWEERLAPGSATVAATLRRELPARLADRLLADLGVTGTTSLGQLPRGDRIRLLDALTRYLLPWTGDEGYKKAEVTGGGLALGEIEPRTMESRRTPGLFLAGELLDAFGPIGGYNFVWAWITGRLAGRGATQSH